MEDALTHLVLLDAPLSARAMPLQRQLQQRLKSAILEGRLAPGTRLPASRTLAESLSISRNTVSIAYEHLAAEGYLLADRQGTRVAALSRQRPSAERRDTQEKPQLARRLDSLLRTPRSTAAYLALRPGQPALSHFPLAAWRRSLDRATRRGGSDALAYGEPAGEAELRASIARYLGVARGVHCLPEQVIITEGTQEALALCVRLLADPGDIAWIEDPGYRGAKTAFFAGDLDVRPKPVDAEGLHVQAKDWAEAPPRLIYVTPSHQYPSGGVLPAARRLDLIAQARRHRAWIIEDDYDSEFRHHGEPIAAMQGMTPHSPVVYIGSFSKTMFPSLRIGFVVLPERLVDATQVAVAELLRGGHRYEQLALADFIESGEFSRHLGRMRRLYRERQQALRAALTRHLDIEHRVLGGQCGLHLTLHLAEGYDDQHIAASAPAHGMQPQALSSFGLTARQTGLVLGYGNTAAEMFDPLARRLAQLSKEARRRI
ncbi:PLP-dependent aminotransferase family protein [Bordetella avium]|uniref:MocR-like pyridoxine biosynthesis transcription factor PdxR n=1 Tax=Bordetella avium TaxID=521 RepID=UPI000E69EAC5|nr:PLP-dependent aminotransferase family protein [Bordetella avium]RIQ18200.1 PLP-dependent aminotransferase family protein [Bordetella avium]RIQ36695.1 PLP-dependent aminotransferase family protein [Bordetella avium]